MRRCCERSPTANAAVNLNAMAMTTVSSATLFVRLRDNARRLLEALLRAAVGRQLSAAKLSAHYPPQCPYHTSLSIQTRRVVGRAR
mmetsp:Transcript_9007/g.23511  ORF Transcript_9007/g.23511 Transcript_9007/m.23511 type:complete len:86 (+) Transcript_9007:724-981(+)